MAGGLLELITNNNSVQGMYLTSKPQITFWKKIYRRHSVFATESVIIQPEDKANFGETVKFIYGNRADLAGISYIVFDLPSLHAFFPKRSELLKQFGSTDLFDLLENLDEEITIAQKRQSVLNELDHYAGQDKINKLLELFPEYALIYFLYNIKQPYHFLPADPSLQKDIYDQWIVKQHLPDDNDKIILQNQIDFWKQLNRKIVTVYKPFINNVPFACQYERESLDRIALPCYQEMTNKIDILFQKYPITEKWHWIDHRQYFWSNFGIELKSRDPPIIDLSKSNENTWVIDYSFHIHQTPIYQLLQEDELNQFLWAYDQLNFSEISSTANHCDYPNNLILIFCLDYIIYQTLCQYQFIKTQTLNNNNHLWRQYTELTQLPQVPNYSHDITYERSSPLYFNEPNTLKKIYSPEIKAVNLDLDYESLIVSATREINLDQSEQFYEIHKTAQELEMILEHDIDMIGKLNDITLEKYQDYQKLKSEIEFALEQGTLYDLDIDSDYRVKIMMEGFNPLVLKEMMGIDFPEYIIEAYSLYHHHSKTIILPGLDTVMTYEDLMKLRLKTLTDHIFKEKNTLDELIEKRESIYDCFFQNGDARCAWIRKLGHFLAEEIQLSSNGQTLDIHPSDWINSFSHLTIEPGKIIGYDTMIGNIPKMFFFNTKEKESMKIYLPLMFWPNRNIYASLPMINLINTQIELTVKIRKLEELTYKERFSQWTKKPVLNGVTLWVDYIFLGETERRIFLANRFQYLIEELQTNTGFQVTDKNLTPIYRIPTTSITKKIITPEGIRGIGLFYNEKMIVETDTYDLEIPYHYPYYIDTIREGKFGNTITDHIERGIIHKKRTEYQLYFKNSVKLLIVLIKMDKHRKPNLRKHNDSYFYGEHQLDNYGVLPYYNLCHWYEYRQKYFNELIMKLMVPDVIGLIHKIQSSHLTLELAFIHDYLSQDKLQIIVDLNFLKFRDLLLSVFPLKILPDEAQVFGLSVTSPISLYELKKRTNILTSQISIYQNNVLNNLLKLYQSGPYNPKLWIQNSDLPASRKSELLQASVSTKMKNRIITQIIVSVYFENDISNYIIEDMVIDLLVKQRMNDLDNLVIDTRCDLIVENPKVNPLINGYLQSYDHPFVAPNYDGQQWTDVAGFQYAYNTPETGVNFHSWAIEPCESNPSGALNMSMLPELKMVYYLDPRINDCNTATIDHLAYGYNIWNVISGLDGKLYSN